jgi:hypothetical protein
VDLLEFVAHSEWPLVAGVALYLMRKPLVEMVARVSPTKVDFLGLKIELERRLEKAEALTAIEQPASPALSKARDVPPSIMAPPTARFKVRDNAPPGVLTDSATPDTSGYAALHAQADALPLGNTAPEIQVLLAWQRLESEVRRLVDERLKPRTGNAQIQAKARNLWHVPHMIESAAKELGLNDDEMAALRELRALRNQIAHSNHPFVMQSDATRFKAIVERLITRMHEGREVDQASREG